jgi:PAS domain S-box-containing protein
MSEDRQRKPARKNDAPGIDGRAGKSEYPVTGPSESPGFDVHLRAILDAVRTKVGHDFGCYKANTLVRRIRRRMLLAKIPTFADYARFLRENREEAGLLQKDLLIGVTEFFRQPQAWEILEQKVISPLVENAQPGSEIRVWVPGCATGQEAYSLAMVLVEEVEKSGKKASIQLFATDSDGAALAAARSGSYSHEEVGRNVSPARLKRFFARKDHLYQVVKTIREKVVFAPQNLTADPPFSRLDLISCRNLLIYLDQEVQKKIIPLFHFALREGGFLFLGTTETVGERQDLFEPVSKKWRIYRRIGVGRPVSAEIPVRSASNPLPFQEKLAAGVSASRMSLASIAQQMLVERFAPACVMIDRKLQVVYVHGAVEQYLTLPSGELTIRVVDMAREGLRARLRGAIGKCLEMNRPVSVIARVRRGRKSTPVKATVALLRYPREADGLLLVTFEDYRVPAAKSPGGATVQSGVHQLEEELKATREELQSAVEQLEASNDQLKASNEEVMAANEELQSANEEMETSKEELQSLNEELNTINTRLEEKVEELESVNNDILNLLSSTNIATVFLDRELKIRRYTPASMRLFSLIPSDVGRPIAEVLRRFSDEALLGDALRVLADLTPLAREVQAEDGGWYIRRITPYRTKDDRIEGVVVTFVDVCDLKGTEEALRRHQEELETARSEAENARRRLAVIVDSIADGFFAFDREWRITHINDATLRQYGKTREEMVGHGLFEVFPAARGSIFETEYRRARESGEPVHFEAPSTASDRTLEIHAYPGPDNMTVLFRDVSERNRMAAALRRAHERAEWLARFPEENSNPVMRVSADGTVLYRNPAASKLAGWAYEVGQHLSNPLLSAVGRAMGGESEAEQALELGGRFYSVGVAPFPGESYANIYARDITETKKAEETLRRYELLSAHAWDIILFMQREDGRILEVNSAAVNAYGYSGDELLTRSIQDLRAPDTRGLTAEQMGEADSRGILFETVHQRKDGSTFPVEVSSRGATIGGVRTLISVIRDITERKRREARIAQLTRLYAVLSQVNEAIVRTPTEEGLYGEVCRIVAEQGGFPLVWVGRLRNGEVLPEAFCGPAADYLKKIRVKTEGELGRGPTGTCIREDRPVINDDFDVNPSTAPWRKPALRFGFRASAAFPLHRQGRVVGTLTLYAAEPGAFDQEQINLLEALCADVSYALDAMRQERLRTEAEESLRLSEARLRLLSDTAGRLLATNDPQQIVDELCLEVMAHLNCQAFFNFLADDAVGRLHLNAWFGIPKEEARKIEWLDYGVAVCGCAARDGCGLVAEHIPTTPDVRTDLVKSYGIKAYACHPLLGRGEKVIGTLSFGTRNRETFTADDLALMKAVADQVAVAMERMRLVRELQRSQAELEERVRERTAELVESNKMLQAEIAERLRLVVAVEQAGEGIAIMDPAGAVVYLNPAFERICGYGERELLGKHYLEILWANRPEAGFGEKMEDFIQGRGVWSGRVSRKRKDGQACELDVALSPIRDRSGVVTNYLAVERDVTREVRLEQHLRQVQKAEALGTLAGGIAHDFNNILNPIFINTELALLDAPDGSPMRHPLQMVLEAAERGRGLVKQIITFSRQKEHEAKPLKAEPLVREALKFLRASLPSTVEIQEKIQKETGFILADPTQIHQVIMNLCSNAAYALRETGGTLEVGLAEVEVDADMAQGNPDLNPGPYLRITVSDTGKGMTKEVMERVFDPFFTTKKPGEGSGMGLSVVQGIVRNGKGAITVYSEVGKGSTFNVFFPRVESGAPSLKVPSEPIATGRGRILVVDDEEAQVQSIRNTLERLGYEVVAKTDSVEALALFRRDSQAFDLVITDQTMPQMTGAKLAEELLRVRPKLPIILCTGFSETIDANRAKASGITHFLMKPFPLREIAETIRRALQKN